MKSFETECPDCGAKEEYITTSKDVLSCAKCGKKPNIIVEKTTTNSSRDEA